MLLREQTVFRCPAGKGWSWADYPRSAGLPPQPGLGALLASGSSGPGLLSCWKWWHTSTESISQSQEQRFLAGFLKRAPPFSSTAFVRFSTFPAVSGKYQL